ncbi:glutaredoxin [Candidatus Saccharibacteria bacterium]|nr:glutaredoxin [Candidatus Saccharibacteria bacterium]NIW79580.1 glutaredoxin [Calditrichia bacterium]
MAFIKDDDRKEIQKRFAELKHPVKIIHFTQQFECDYCRETRELLEELAALSDKITFEVYDFQQDKDKAKQYAIDKIPATVIMSEKDYGIRFYGIPSGYEFSTLLEDIIMISKRDSGLSQSTKEKLGDLKHDLHLQVFVTPTCPYCPKAVLLAHQFAMETDRITADMVEAIEFPQLSQKYNVRGVPKTVANDKDAAEGAVPEDYLLQNVLSLAK